MHSTKSKISLLLSLLFLFVFIAPAYCATSSSKFSDMNDSHWAYKFVSAMLTGNILSGYPDGSFKPEKTITRAEFAKILVNASGLTPKTVSAPSFSDIKTSDWYCTYIETAKDYLAGYRDQNNNYTFEPGNVALREDIAVALVKIMGYDQQSTPNLNILESSFTDFNTISESARSYVALAVEHKLISGFEDKTFRPHDSVTRAQAATVLFRAFLSSLNTDTSSDTTSDTTNYTAEGVITSYFDLLDFMRTNAWNKSYTTSSNERERVISLVQNSWPTLDEQSKTSLTQIADAWSNLKSSWPTMTLEKQNELKANWYKLLLSPDLIYPALDNPNVYQSGNTAYFQYPGNWTGGETAANGDYYLFIGPGGNSASLDQVMNSSTSPSGNFVVATPITSEMQSLSAIQGARLYAQTYVTGNSSDMKEIYAQEGSQGALVAYLGHFPGQSEEKFFWVVVIPFGQQVLVCRMGGSVSQADVLVPSFWNILSTLQLNPPTGSSSSSSGSQGEAGAAWDAAWSKVSTSVVLNIWAK